MSSGSWYYYLVSRSGEWDSKEALLNVYLSHCKHVYTEGMWGVDAPQAYDRNIQGTEVIFRSWHDSARSPLSDKYGWWMDGSLSLAVKQLTGKEPEFLFVDVRDMDDAKMIDAEDAVRRDFHVRLFNRKWIEGMMKEGYAGADQVAKHVSNAMGWEIMRENSVADEHWQEIVNVYIRDSKQMNIREWFEAENPFAYQEITEILLETIRKGYWTPDKATVLEIATEYAHSVRRHGEGGGLRGGGNTKLEEFIKETLRAPGTKELETLLKEYEAKSRELKEPAPTAKAPETEVVEGKKMEPTEKVSESPQTWPFVIATAVLLVFLFGTWKRMGVPR